MICALAMARLVVLESMWNPKGKLLNEEPSVLPYLKAIRQSLHWEGLRINLVYRRFYSHYDLGLLLKEVRRHRKPQVCYISSHGEHRKLTGLGDKVIRLESLIEYTRPSPTTGYIVGACEFVSPTRRESSSRPRERASWRATRRKSRGPNPCWSTASSSPTYSAVA